MQTCAPWRKDGEKSHLFEQPEDFPGALLVLLVYREYRVEQYEKGPKIQKLTNGSIDRKILISKSD